VKAGLPANTDLNAATAGFKNFGQFVAAVNVSNNLGIPFADLKSRMTGITMTGEATGAPTSSLGQAIHQLNGTVDAPAEAQRAQTQANRDIAVTTTTITTTTTTTATTAPTTAPATTRVTR
jgi:hypothetical protein